MSARNLSSEKAGTVHSHRAYRLHPLEPDNKHAPGSSGPRNYLLIAAVLLFLPVMLFLFNATSLQLQVQSETPADTSITGIALPLGERYLLLPGNYSVKVAAEGYLPLATEILVEDRDSQIIELVPEPMPGRLNVDSNPPGADVSLNGQLLGKTPLHGIVAEGGEKQLLLEHPRYLPIEETLHISGRDILQQLSYSLEPGWADVTVNSIPPGATIFIDGASAGTTPAVVPILRGEHQLALQLDSFTTWELPILVTPGEARDLGSIELTPAKGSLTLDSIPSGANVTVDGKFRGQTPLTLALPPATQYQLALFKAGYRRHLETVSFEANDRLTKNITLEAQAGEVRFRISPEAALLRINGKARGTGSRTLALPAVEQLVEVSLAGHATVRRQVLPRTGLTQQVNITLLTEQAARLAATPKKVTTSLGQSLVLFNPESSSQAEFTMGASRRDPGRRANEVLRKVTLSRMFYLQSREITNAQFRKFQADHKSGQVSGKSLNREQQPVVQVSWQQAASFCNWLSQREGLAPFYLENQGIIVGFNPDSTGYRLPSEAEWAWAARVSGKNLLTFPWMGQFPPTTAVENYADASSAFITGRALKNYNDGQVVSAKVASFGPNQHGLFDMGGNVAEWVHDVYTIPGADAPALANPLGQQTGDNHVVRGASWAHGRRTELRLSYRDYGQAGRDDVGFRIARYAE